MKISISVRSVFIFAVSVVFASTDGNRSSQTASANDHGHDHPSAPPHRGKQVKVGDHDFHLELVNNTHAGKMLAYVHDDHLEHAESIPPTTLDCFKNATNFEGLIPSITLKGETFMNVPFGFPKGTRHKH